MGEVKDFWHSDLRRIIRDLESELEKDLPDWRRVLAKGWDLDALARAAMKDKGQVLKARVVTRRKEISE